MKRIDARTELQEAIFTPLTRHTAGGGGRIFNNRLIICLGHCVLLFLIPGDFVHSILRPGQPHQTERSQRKQSVLA